MGQLMAQDLAEVIDRNNHQGLATRAIIPCGPNCWYTPFSDLVNTRQLSLNNLEVFHMDECLDWQAQLLQSIIRTISAPSWRNISTATFSRVCCSPKNRYWLSPSTMETVKVAIQSAPIDITVGGWGQDGHVAYNQARRHPFHHVGIDELARSTIRIQENNIDTILSLAQRTFGAAYQFVPPMSITLGLQECLSARKVRVYSDTGAWKQTALRVALFSEPVAEYPLTLLQQHSDACITATRETARHPISENPDWELL